MVFGDVYDDYGWEDVEGFVYCGVYVIGVVDEVVLFGVELDGVFVILIEVVYVVEFGVFFFGVVGVVD